MTKIKGKQNVIAPKKLYVREGNQVDGASKNIALYDIVKFDVESRYNILNLIY